MLKVRIKYKENEPPIVYDNVENIYTYPEPERITKAYCSICQRDINNRRYYTNIYNKPLVILIESMPIKTYYVDFG